MTSLLDIGVMAITVEIRGKEIEVSGITAEGLVYLLQSSEELRKLFAGRGSEIQMEDMLRQSPALIAKFMASGCGYAGNAEAEARVRGLGASDQIALMEAVWRATFPKGLKDFLAALDRLTVTLGGGSGWVQAMTSLEPSISASAKAIRPETLGDTLHVNSQAGESSSPAAA
jgi:hypothetical protein